MLAAAIALAFTSAPSEMGTNISLLRMCQQRNGGEPVMEMLYCAAYIGGVIDGHRIAMDFAETEALYCTPPEGISVEQGVRLFVAWAESPENADKLHLSEKTGVTLALMAAFPCDKAR